MPIHSYEVQKVSGKALNNFINQARQIVIYLERGYQLRISKAVFDFVQDV